MYTTAGTFMKCTLSPILNQVFPSYWTRFCPFKRQVYRLVTFYIKHTKCLLLWVMDQKVTGRLWDQDRVHHLATGKQGDFIFSFLLLFDFLSCLWHLSKINSIFSFLFPQNNSWISWGLRIPSQLKFQQYSLNIIPQTLNWSSDVGLEDNDYF